MRDVTGAMRWDGSGWQLAEPPPAPQEMPVAIVIDGMSQAVLMATPHDLRDFALGFALTEGLIARPDDVLDFEEAEVMAGGFPAREARLWLRPGLAAGLAERRRSMVGPVGCGLCGVDSIAAALPAVVPAVSDWIMPPQDVGRAMAALSNGQLLRRQSPAIHGAAFWDGVRALVREDVGRHNALDKLAGALAKWSSAEESEDRPWSAEPACPHEDLAEPGSTGSAVAVPALAEQEPSAHLPPQPVAAGADPAGSMPEGRLPADGQCVPLKETAPPGPAARGAIVMSSRISVDLVQKAARIGAPILIGASAPTELALDWAQRAGITLIARARGDAFDLYTHPQRIAGT